MPGPSEFKAPVLSDSELSNMKLPSLKKVSKQIVHAMRFMKPQDSENEPSTIDRQCHAFSDAQVHVSFTKLNFFLSQSSIMVLNFAFRQMGISSRKTLILIPNTTCIYRDWLLKTVKIFRLLEIFMN